MQTETISPRYYDGLRAARAAALTWTEWRREFLTTPEKGQEAQETIARYYPHRVDLPEGMLDGGFIGLDRFRGEVAEHFGPGGVTYVDETGPQYRRIIDAAPHPGRWVMTIHDLSHLRPYSSALHYYFSVWFTDEDDAFDFKIRFYKS